MCMWRCWVHVESPDDVDAGVNDTCHDPVCRPTRFAPGVMVTGATAVCTKHTLRWCQGALCKGRWLQLAWSESNTGEGERDCDP